METWRRLTRLRFGSTAGRFGPAGVAHGKARRFRAAELCVAGGRLATDAHASTGRSWPSDVFPGYLAPVTGTDITAGAVRPLARHRLGRSLSSLSPLAWPPDPRGPTLLAWVPTFVGMRAQPLRSRAGGPSHCHGQPTRPA